MFVSRLSVSACLLAILPVAFVLVDFAGAAENESASPRDFDPVRFNVRSVKDGRWSDPSVWDAKRLPKSGDRVQVARGTRVVYDVESNEVVRLLQVVGALSFARDRNTLLNVGILKVQNSDACSEAGFACDFSTVNDVGEPHALPDGEVPSLEIGTLGNPIPAEFTARIRLHYLDGMNKNDAPALACCSARMDLHGAPLSRTWVKLGADVAEGDLTVTLAEDVTGWKVGDEVIVTGSKHQYANGGFRKDPEATSTEPRRVVRIEGRTLTLDKPLAREHFGSGKFRSEVGNLSRNVIIESADPEGVRGHTVYHRFSQGGISYARFAHLGKEGVLGRYSIHFHLLGESNRGGGVVGAAIVDSHNRWITIHGTNYLVVRDCVGFKSVGHGYFLEDGTETYNVLDRNLGVQAYFGKRLPKQVLPFDPNDGAAFWWSNGRNAITRNVACENDRYGFRYDSQKRSNFDSNLLVMDEDGATRSVDIRTIPFYRFEDNETHTEGLYGMAFAGTDRAGPDVRHPRIIKNLKIWQVHYALRTELATMWVENVDIFHAVYGVYRPEFDNHVYRNLYIGFTSSEPFNRGLDDRSLQYGSLTVDGLTFEGSLRRDGIPLIQISANNPSGKAESHFRNVKVLNRSENDRRSLINLGGGPRLKPGTPKGVPIYLHDWHGPGRHAKVVSARAKDLLSDGNQYRSDPPLTGDESRAAEVRDVDFPKLLDPVDDLAPATVITFPPRGVPVKLDAGTLIVRGTTTDNVKTAKVVVNGIAAKDIDYNYHQWEVHLTGLQPGKIIVEASAQDAAGNQEKNPHRLTVEAR
ncbi:MAG: G8 domain-containing protein [Planctomycetales bacterium]